MRHFGWISNTAYHLNKTFGVNFNHCVVTFYYFIRLCVVTSPHAYFRSTKVTEIVAIFLTLNHCKESFNLVTTIPLSRSLSLFGNVFLQLLLVCQNRHQTVARNSIKRCFCCLVLQDRCRIARQYCCSFGSCIVISPKNLQVLQQ